MPRVTFRSVIQKREQFKDAILAKKTASPRLCRAHAFLCARPRAHLADTPALDRITERTVADSCRLQTVTRSCKGAVRKSARWQKQPRPRQRNLINKPPMTHTSRRVFAGAGRYVLALPWLESLGLAVEQKPAQRAVFYYVQIGVVRRSFSGEEIKITPKFGGNKQSAFKTANLKVGTHRCSLRRRCSRWPR